MRQPVLQAATLGALGVLCACAASPEPQAATAQHFAAPAAATAPAAQTGYSDGARRLADCLASYPGYDYRTDRYQAAPGVTAPCPL
jgi:hypothetical protein